jgi:hypothetical protein
VEFHYSKLLVSTVFLFSFALSETAGQTKASGEVGVFAGGSYYLGDLNKIPFVGTNLAFGVLYRHTIDSRFSATGNLNYGHISGDASEVQYDFPNNYTFKNVFYELNGQLEFNFLPYTPTSKKTRYTPVVFAGVGMMYYPKGTRKFIFNIPFGIGIKYNIYKNYMLGINAGMRKTFRDDLDYPYSPPPQDNPMQNNYAGNDDWYSVFGVYLSYKIKYRQKCPAFD